MRRGLPEPPNPAVPLPSAEDIQACRMRLRNGSRSFYAASLLLPQDMAACATALYAFAGMSTMRWTRRVGRKMR